MVALTLSSLLLATTLLTPYAEAGDFTRDAWAQSCAFPPATGVKDEVFMCTCLYVGLVRDVPADELSRIWNGPPAELGKRLTSHPRMPNIEAGCVQLDDNLGGRPNRDPALETFIAAQGFYTFQLTPEGVYYMLAKPGVGPRAAVGQTAVLHYKLLPLDGETIVASSEADGHPLTMKVGAGQMIRGMDLGVQLFAEGGKGVLLVPFALGYGERGLPPVIPARSTLVVEIELLDLQ